MGPLPPPLGGISTHIERIAKKLQHQNNRVYHWQSAAEYRYRYFFAYLIKLIFFLLFHRPDILYFHTLYLSNGLSELWLLTFLKKILRYRLILIEHDCRYLNTKSLRWKNRFNRLTCAIDTQIFMGVTTFEHRQKHDILQPIDFSIEGAFLPPDTSQQKEVEKKYTAALWHFVRTKRPLILMNAFVFSPVGNDIYGIDVALQAFVRLKQKYPSSGLLIFLAQQNNSVHLHEHIRHVSIEEGVHVIAHGQELWPLLTYADIFIRPTRSDGASVSIMEALHAGIPVVASDAAVRPPQVILHQTGNENDLYEKMDIVLQKGTPYEASFKRRDIVHAQ